jgi:sugar-phosphatase
VLWTPSFSSCHNRIGASGQGILTSMIKAVIFDMDGLLIDSEPLWQEAEIAAFAKVRLVLSIEKTRQTMGLRVDEVVQYWYAREPWDATSQEQVKVDIVNNVISLIKTKGTPMKGVSHAIDVCEKQNLPMAIASSSLTEIIDAVLEKIGVRDKMSVIHSAEHEPYGKPHPGVYITTAGKLGVRPEECLAFEDSPNGVLSAKAAKMKCIAIPDQNFETDRRIAIADLALESLDEFSSEHILLLN